VAPAATVRTTSRQWKQLASVDGLAVHASSTWRDLDLGCIGLLEITHHVDLFLYRQAASSKLAFIFLKQLFYFLI
jgi:hypothetical protein